MLVDLLRKQVIMLKLPREREGKIPNITGLATTVALTAI